MRINTHSLPKEGFTLIELIVVITVIAILSTIGVVSFVGYSRSQVLDQATLDLVQTLNTAKSLSAAQLTISTKNNEKANCQSFQTLNGYGVRLYQKQMNGKTLGYYKLYLECVANGVEHQYPDLSRSDWQTNLPSNVIFDTTATNITDVFFPVLSGGVLITGSLSTDTIALTSYGNTKTVKFINGIISISQ
jgi:prepilin-type N-terminal cleavage/methylation domain-containing protein